MTRKNAYEILDQDKDLSPKQIYDGEKVISTPQKLADAFNTIFLNQVKQLRNKVTTGASIEPASWQR